MCFVFCCNGVDFARQRSQTSGKTPPAAVGVSNASAEETCREVPQAAEGQCLVFVRSAQHVL